MCPVHSAWVLCIPERLRRIAVFRYGLDVCQRRHDGDGGNGIRDRPGRRVRSIAFDLYGNYGGDMIVATQVGRIYRVNSAGVATQIANLGVDTEGMDFAPQAFRSDRRGDPRRAVRGRRPRPGDHPDRYGHGLGVTFSTPEMLSFVPLDFAETLDPLAGFLRSAVPTRSSSLLRATSHRSAGQAVITEELTHDLYSISWNGTQFR